MKDYRLSFTTLAHNDFSQCEGRTHVVGDIHGRLDRLYEQLAACDFSPARDRLLFCGDLINRGTDSLESLKLLNEPWLYPVLGNHDYRMLGTYRDYLTDVNSREEYLDALSRMDEKEVVFASKYATWLEDLSHQEWSELHTLMPLLQTMPLARHVITEDGDHIGIVHNNVWGDRFLAMKDLDGSNIQVIDHLIFNRPFVFEVLHSMTPEAIGLQGRDTLIHDASLVPQQHGACWIKDVDLVIHGHTTFRSPTLVGNRLYLETGSYEADGLMTVRSTASLMRDLRQAPSPQEHETDFSFSP